MIAALALAVCAAQGSGFEDVGFQATPKFGAFFGALPPGMIAEIQPGDEFGRAIADLGDVNGDGAPDVAVGAHLDDAGGTDRGAVWVLFLEPDGALQSYTRIDATHPLLATQLADGDAFGSSLASVGDLDGDGIAELAVGAIGDDTGGSDRGAVHLLWLGADGQPWMQRKLAHGLSGLSANLGDGDAFGHGVEGLGDFGGDGIPDLAVGARFHDAGGTDTGAVWVLHLNADGSVQSEFALDGSTSGPDGWMIAGGEFGSDIAALGDFNGDGTGDIAVGAPGTDDGGERAGAVWVLILKPDGQPKLQVKLSETSGELTIFLSDNDQFGERLAAAGDLGGDGVPDLLVGEGGGGGWAWLLELQANAKAKQLHSLHFPIDVGVHPPHGSLAGSGLELAPDFDGDGRRELYVGYRAESAPEPSQGALRWLSLDASFDVQAVEVFSAAMSGIGPSALTPGFGETVCGLGDLDGDGIDELAVYAPGYSSPGVVWIVFLDAQGVVRDAQAIGSGLGGFDGILSSTNDTFGAALEPLGDWNGDGVPDLAVGNPKANSQEGEVWVLYLNADGSVAQEVRIAAGTEGFQQSFGCCVRFGSSLCSMDDVNGDGRAELAVGAPGWEPGAGGKGAVFLLFSNDPAQPDWVGGHHVLAWPDVDLDDSGFGLSLCSPGDLDGNGVPELLVGSYEGANGEPNGAGQVHLLFLVPGGGILQEQVFVQEFHPFELNAQSLFGAQLVDLGDWNQDGLRDLLVTEPGDRSFPQGEGVRGSIWFVSLNSDGSLVHPTEVHGLHPDLSGLEELQWYEHWYSAWGVTGDLDGDGLRDLILGLGQEFEVVVLQPDLPGEATAYGCGLNPMGSLRVGLGTPQLGTTPQLYVEPPSATPLPLEGFLALAQLPDLAFPCGTPLAGWGFGGAAGELLIDSASLGALLPLPTWTPGTGPAVLPLALPQSAPLVGATLYAQAVLLDLASATPGIAGLTNALQLDLDD